MKTVIKAEVKRPTIESIKIKHVLDEDPDTSWMGEFSDDPEEGAIDHSEREGSSRSLKYFNPANPEYAEQQYKRMIELEHGHFSFIGIIAEANILIPQGDHFICQKLSSGGLWGIENDSADSYINEEEDNQLDELKEVLSSLNVNLKNFDKLAKDAKNVSDKFCYGGR